MNRQSRVEAALDDAIGAVSGGASASDVVRAALRVAVLRQDLVAESWLRLEMAGVKRTGQQLDDLKPLMARLSALLGDKEAEAQTVASTELLIARRTIDDSGTMKVLAHGVTELEVLGRSMRDLYDTPIQAGMTPIDTGLASINRDKARVTIAPQMIQMTTVVERIKDAAYRYLMDVEGQFLAGELTPDVITRGQAFVEQELATIAPDALTALLAAQDRLQAGNDEALSHVATSCRRVLKALADALYPAGEPVTDGNGVSRKMDNDHYRNRLTEYVRARKKRSTHADLLASNLESLGNRLKSLDDLASKGVHTQVSLSEAESCLSWVYMLAADLLRVHEQAPQL